MPRKILILFVGMGTFALLMCGALIYLGRWKWVAGIVGLHVLVVILWYAIRAVRPYQPDLLQMPPTYQDASELQVSVSASAVEKDWAADPPPAQEWRSATEQLDPPPNAAAEKDSKSQPPQVNEP